MESPKTIFFLTEKMYLNRREVEEIAVHRRGGRGVNGTMLHHGDSIKQIATCANSASILFFTDKGDVFSKRTSEINDLGRKGVSVAELIQLPEGDAVDFILPMEDRDFEDPNFSLLFATKKGLIKKTKIEEFRRINVNGKAAIALREGDAIGGVTKVDEGSFICLASDSGNMVRFSSAAEVADPETGEKIPNFSHSGRTAAGRYGIALDEGEKLASLSTTLEGDMVLSIGEGGIGKISALEDFRETSIGRKKGNRAQRINEKTGKLLACTLVKREDEILLVTSANKINRFRVGELNLQGRDTAGVILIDLGEGERVISFAKN